MNRTTKERIKAKNKMRKQRRSMNKLPRIGKRTIKFLNFHEEHQDDPEYVNKKFTRPHGPVHKDYAMVLVTPNNQLEFNTSVRYLDGVPAPIGNFMKFNNIKAYQGLVCGRPGGVIHKDIMYQVFEQYGVYQVMLCKAYRLLGNNPNNWLSVHNKDMMRDIMDEWMEYVRKEAAIAEGTVAYHANQFMYREQFVENKWDFGFVPEHLQ